MGRSTDSSRSPARTADLVVITYGLSVGLRADDDRTMSRLCERLPPGWRPTRACRVARQYSWTHPRNGERHALSVDGTVVATGLSMAQVLDAFESNLQIYVAEWAPRHVFVHAGVVGWRGRAILLPGQSGSGKTTLVSALLRAGATYYSDEYAVLDRRGRVHPYARRLALRRGIARRVRRTAESLGAAIGRGPVPVGLVVASRYQPRAHWRPQQLSPAAGALALLANTVSARRGPDLAMTAIQAVVERAPVIRSVRGEARETARTLLASLERSATAPAVPTPTRRRDPRSG